jgi:hypothetical protein
VLDRLSHCSGLILRLGCLPRAASWPGRPAAAVRTQVPLALVGRLQETRERSGGAEEDGRGQSGLKSALFGGLRLVEPL